MPAVLVKLHTRVTPQEHTEDPDLIKTIDDLDEVIESTMCSCNAGDDQPY